MSGAESPISPGGILNGVVTNVVAGGNPIAGAMMNAAALAGSNGFGSDGGSLFGFEPDLTGVGQGIWEGVTGVNQWMNQNPFAAQMGLKAGSALLQQPQMRPMGGGGQISRGQIPQMDFTNLLNPQQQNVIRPQAMSLL